MHALPGLFDQPIGERGRGARERRVGDVRTIVTRRQRVELRRPIGRGTGVVRQDDLEVGQHEHLLRLSLGGGDRVAEPSSRVEQPQPGPDKRDVRLLRRQLQRRIAADRDRDDRLSLRRPRGDRRPFDRQPAALVVDVVQPLAVDEAVGRGVADLGVILPAVPQPPHRLDVLGGLANAVATGATDRGPTYSASDSRSDTITDQPARPPLTWSRVAICVETKNGSVVTVGISGTSPTAIARPAPPGRRSASGRARQPRARAVPGRCRGSGHDGPSASVTNSNPPRSASAITLAQ